MYARLFPPDCIDECDCGSIDDIPLRGLSGWNASTEDDDFSVFEIYELKKDQISDWIVLRGLADNFTKRKLGVDLFVLDDSFATNFTIEKDATKKLNCFHANLKEINYYKYKKIIEYMYKNKKNVINYDSVQIKKLIHGLSNNEFDEFIDYYLKKHPKDNANKFKSQVRNSFFSGENEENIPNFLKN